MYLSNESKTAVYFDNFDVTHIRGRLVKENAYYAYGLKIKGISARAFSKGSNPYGYQGDFSEGDAETGWDEFDLRMYDAQIGRWTAVDPYDEFAGPYIGMGANPVNLIDPSGGSIFNFFSSAFLNHVADAFVGGIAGAVISGAKNGWSKDAMFKGMGNGALVGLGASLTDWDDISSIISLGWNMGGLRGTNFPDFATLYRNYPKPYSHKPDRTPANPNIPVDDKKNETFLYPDQCAIRLSISLEKSGVDLSGVKNVTNPGYKTYNKDGYVLGAKNLIIHLQKKILNKDPQTFNGKEKDVKIILKGKTGIIFFGQYTQSNGTIAEAHIDLWTGYDLFNPSPQSTFFTAKDIRFFEIK